MKQKPKDLHIFKLKVIKFCNQLTEPSDREIYPSNEQLKHFLNRLTSYSRKLLALEI